MALHHGKPPGSLIGVGVVLLIFVVAGTALLTAKGARDLGREVLAPNDGWASYGSGTTGGATAELTQVYTVTNRAQLIAALNNGTFSSTSPSNPSDEPKIIYVRGTVDLNVDDNNQPLTCEDYYRNGYTLEAFLAAYDPAVWGRKAPAGPLETARLASRDAQQARVRIRVGSNTTLLGVDRRAIIRGAWFDLRGSATTNRTNIIIRNLRFEDTYDCFPEWSPTDGALGSWNALYDAISLRDTNHVWIDHNDLVDVTTADELLPHYFGVLYQVHDGLVDITNASNHVTVSWNRFMHHDKVMLIGSSDSASADRGKLNVTLHHNLFENTGQRTPRVRFGQVHVYDNYYFLKQVPNYGYSWGVGIESAIYAENNFFRLDESILPADLISVFKGTVITTLDTQVNAASVNHMVDVRSAYNLVNNPDLLEVTWTPTLHTHIDEAFRVPSLVMSEAGPFNW